jgi:AraC family transcriptional regulator
VKTPNRTTAAAFPRYAAGHVLADSASLHWRGLYVRRYRFPRVVDRFLVPATAEPLISCGLAGSAEFLEREVGKTWVSRQITQGHIFVTRSKTPYEVRFRSPVGQELEIIQVHVAVDQFLRALEEMYPGRADEVEVLDFYGSDPALSHLCSVCAEMLAERVPGKSMRVAAITNLFAACLSEKYTIASAGQRGLRGGLPIWQLHKLEEYIGAHLREEISIDALAELAGLSAFHFSRVFKETTGMSPLQFVTRQRITRAQRYVRETTSSLLEISLDVGYTSPSHFAKVFRRVTGVTPIQFRNSL